MKSLEELAKIREEALKVIELRDGSKDVRIVVGMATCGITAGARPVLIKFIEEVNNRNLNNVIVEQVGCIGMCRYEPMVEVFKDGEKVTYIELTPEKVSKIVAEHIVNGKVVSEFTIGSAEK